MARSIWNGAVTFGLITVPIKVHSAVEDKSVHFHQVHVKDGARIKLKRICSKEGEEVPYEAVAKGYELRGGQYVLLSQEEIDAAAGERSRLIALEEFVHREEIDPVFYDRTYYVGAGDDGEEAYRLLHDALHKAGRTGIGRWVFHNREYLVAIRPLDGVLALHTMRFADEIVGVGDLDLPEPGRKPTPKEIEMAGALVETLHDRFEPSAFKAAYRKRVLELIRRKAKGEEIEIPEREAPEASPDLLAALEASLDGKSSRRRSKPQSGKAKRGGRASKAKR